MGTKPAYRPLRHVTPVAPVASTGRRRRWRDVVATFLMIALLPALLVPSGGVEGSDQPPRIVGQTIAPEARGVSILQFVSVRFDRPVTRVNDRTFVLRDSDGRRVPAVVRYDAARYRAELIPVDGLRPYERYRVHLSSDIRSAAGVPLPPVTWAFKTAHEPSDATRFLPSRLVRLAAGAVTGVQVDANGQTIRSLSGRLSAHAWATAHAKVTIRGRTYYYITDGTWTGYFVPSWSVVAVKAAGDGPSPAPTPSPRPTTQPLPSAPPSPAPAVTPTPSPTQKPTPSASSAPTPTAQPQPQTSGAGIIASPADIGSLPTTGPAWEALRRAADSGAGNPNLSDMNQDNNVQILAKALVYARTGATSYRSEVIAAVRGVMGTEAGAETLAVGRELAAYVIAADIIGLRSADPALDAGFRAWLAGLLDRPLAGGDSITTTHERRPNNWGTHNGASRAAIAAYLGDSAELARVAAVFRGWLGERQSYAGFKYGDLWWQANAAQPVGINPPGATISGRNVDGVLPEEQRRTGGFTWPPPCGNYPHGALDGALLTAEILYRAGYPAYEWGSRALLRAEIWLQSTGCPPTGDNGWQLPLLDARYGTAFWNGAVVPPGKNFAWTDWLYGR